MREFAQWWLDDGRQTPCCQTSSADVVATDPDVFHCDTCEMGRRWRGLDADNADAWHLYQRLVTRFAMETHTVGVQLARVLAECDDEQAGEICDRLAILYDVLVPVRTPRDA